MADRMVIKKVHCLVCGNVWRAMFPYSKDASSKLECPMCHNQRSRILARSENEVKHGEWIENDNGTYSCSLCQSWVPKEQYYYARYCLHCGADMRERRDENDTANEYVKVVRCKDCKHYKQSIYFAPEKMCYRYYDNNGDVIGYIKSDNDYCSYGKRRESE